LVPVGTVFSWNVPLGAKRYNFQVDTENSFSVPLLVDQIDLTEASVKPPLTDLGTYYWRVQARDLFGNIGPWSSVFTVTIVEPAAPTIITPANNANVVGYPNFSWSAVPGAKYYDVQFDRAITMDDDPTISVQAGTSLTGVQMYLGATYWRVRVEDDAGHFSDWSAVRTVNTVEAGPVTISSPANGASVVGIMKVVFPAVSGARVYQLELDTVPTFDSANLTENVSDVTPIEINPFSAGLWYWHVRVYDQNYIFGAWSGTRTVTFKAPKAPTLSSPKNGKTITYPAPFLLSWKAVTGASKYKIEIDNDSDFSSPTLTNDAVLGLNFNDILGVLVRGNTYYWRVKAIDAGGNESVWSVVYSVMYN
jgi:hypothetical protein